jgi:hypothetical protein
MGPKRSGIRADEQRVAVERATVIAGDHPPAPGRFSMMSGWPSNHRCRPAARGADADVAAGGIGHHQRIGFDGNCCADNSGPSENTTGASSRQLDMMFS